MLYSQSNETVLKKIWILFSAFFKIGAFTLGGGYAMLPLIEKEFVEVRGWVTEEDMVDILAIVQSLPGVIAINTSLFIGYKVAGLPGALLALCGMVLPSLIIIILFALLYVSVQNNPYVQGAFRGVRAGVTGLILLAGIKLGKKVIKNGISLAIAITTFVCVWWFSIHAALAILGSAFVGLVVYTIKKVKTDAL